MIISASRRTDIPTYYADWFMNRIREGFVCVRNPMNIHQVSRVALTPDVVDAIVFWTKNPKPILPYLHELDERGIHYYFQVTLNDYVQEGFEPNVPSVDERVATFRELSERIGRGRVVWRFDPLIVTPKLTPRDLLKRIWTVGNKLFGLTDKLVFSFVDVAEIGRAHV